MKIRRSITIDRDTDKMLDDLVADGMFRNYSHAVEIIIKKFWGEKHGKFKK